MPTYTTPNSTQTYTVPSGVTQVGVRLRGAGGTAGGEGGASGGPGGRVTGRLSVSPGDTLTIELAGIPHSPHYNGGAGGEHPVDDTSGGDGGGSTRLLQDGTTAAVADGGGGGGSGYFESGNSPGSEGGGGGARGGAGGVAMGYDDTYFDGGDGGGTGAGGAGGDGGRDRFDEDMSAGGAGGGAAQLLADATITPGGGMEGGATAEVDIVPTPDRVTHFSTVPSPSSIQLSWTDTSSEDGYRILLDGSVITTCAADRESYTVTGLTEGVTYEVGVEAFESITGSGQTRARTVTTVLPRPTGLEVVETRLREVDLAWTLHSTDETRIDVLVSTDGGASWSVAQQLPPGTESATLTGLLDGTDYQFAVEVIGADVTERREFY